MITGDLDDSGLHEPDGGNELQFAEPNGTGKIYKKSRELYVK